MGNAAQHLLRKHPVLAVHLASAVPQREIVAILLSSALLLIYANLPLALVTLRVPMESAEQPQLRTHRVLVAALGAAAQ